MPEMAIAKGGIGTSQFQFVVHGRSLFPQTIPLGDRGGDWALRCAVSLGRGAASRKIATALHPAGCSDKVKTASFLMPSTHQLQHSATILETHLRSDEVIARRSVVSQTGLEQIGYRCELLYQNDLVRQFARTDILLKRCRCQDLARRNLGRGLPR
jgi:hypothetical protein